METSHILLTVWETRQSQTQPTLTGGLTGIMSVAAECLVSTTVEMTDLAAGRSVKESSPQNVTAELSIFNG